jgi:hypothetical protein
MYAPIRGYTREPAGGAASKFEYDQNLIGSYLQKTIHFRNGAEASGPVDDEGDPHGQRFIYVGGGDSHFEWYYHGEKCTTSDFYKWSN